MRNPVDSNLNETSLDSKRGGNRGMGAFRKKKVHPSNSNGLDPRRNKVRWNGWSLPLHHLQIMAWVFLLLFGIVYYGVMVPSLPTRMCRYFAASINGILYVTHIVIHLISITMNPADINVIRKYKKSKTSIRPNTFDRTKHAHVIENEFCYICEVTVSTKAKHCSLCNKCVSDFDHHCKWLNNCVGGRNYRYFLGCVVTAAFGSFNVLAVSIALVVSFFKHDSWLYDSSVESSTLISLFVTKDGKGSMVFSDASSAYRTWWISIIIITLILSLVSLILLSHLLCFHIYLKYRGLSTYDFIVQRRQKEQTQEKQSSKQLQPWKSLMNGVCSTSIIRCTKSRKKKKGTGGLQLSKEERETGEESGHRKSPDDENDASYSISPTYVEHILEAASNNKQKKGSSDDKEKTSKHNFNQDEAQKRESASEFRTKLYRGSSVNNEDPHGEVYLGSPQKHMLEELRFLNKSSSKEGTKEENVSQKSEADSQSSREPNGTSHASSKAFISHQSENGGNRRRTSDNLMSLDFRPSQPIFNPLHYGNNRNGRVSRLSFVPKGNYFSTPPEILQPNGAHLLLLSNRLYMNRNGHESNVIMEPTMVSINNNRNNTLSNMAHKGPKSLDSVPNEDLGMELNPEEGKNKDRLLKYLEERQS